MSWETIIGLEIHVQLKTRTKMFCRCTNGSGAAPNTTTCPICLGHPGSLPVSNRAAVEWAIDLGRALGCAIAERALFHRKSYFYPDLAKGYQISQYDEPLCVGGTFVVPGRRRRSRSRDRARAPGRGRCEDRPRRGRGRADRRRRPFARRLQPRWRAAGRDRDAARPPLLRRRAALPPVAAPDDRRAGRLRCGDGERHVARRRQRVGASGGRGWLPDALGAQEHELLQFHRARHRRRRARTDRTVRGWAGRRPGDVRLRRRLGHA